MGLIVSLMLLLLSCSRKDSIKEVIFLRLNENPSTIDPARVVDVSGGEICAKIHSGLVRFDDKLNIVGDLCEYYKVKDNGTSIEFKLKEKIFFSNGIAITAKAVEASWKRVLDPNNPSPRKWVLERIKGAKEYLEGKSESISGIKIIDDRNFEILLDQPFSPFLSLMTMPAAAIVYPDESNSEELKTGVNVIGAGPYSVVKWAQDEYLEFEPNKYYNSDKERTCLLYKIIPEDSSAVAMMSTGELDIIKVPKQQLDFMKRTMNNLKFSEIEELNTYYLGINHRNEYLDLDFKKSVNHAINKDEIVSGLLKNQSVKAFGPIPPVLSPGIKDKGEYDYNPGKAKEYYQKSKAYNKRIKFLISSSNELLSIAVVIQDKLKNIGMDVVLEILDWSAFKEAITKGECDIFIMSWWADYADPENFLYPTFHSSNRGAGGNRTWYSSAEMDSLLEKLNLTSQEIERKELLNKINEVFLMDLPWIPLWHKTSVFACNNKVKGFKPVPMYTMDKGIELIIENS
ncbi:MAG: hypothetical protein ACD_79C00764G0003 [uncultured bacterium]|nr:MAG: hypothetical protein ACD_79C00764G0003 [uncultured bacterium]